MDSFFKDIVRRAIHIHSYYGKEHQRIKMCEEAAEVIQATLKNDRVNMIKEMADLFSMGVQVFYRDLTKIERLQFINEVITKQNKTIENIRKEEDERDNNRRNSKRKRQAKV